MSFIRKVNRNSQTQLLGWLGDLHLQSAQESECEKPFKNNVQIANTQMCNARRARRFRNKGPKRVMCA
jgi:hypothetical protein